MPSKIVIGTVQFGLDYGINNTKGKICKEEIFNILDYAWDHGAKMLDTAFSYGQIELILGEYQKDRNRHLDIVSKINPRCKNNETIDESLRHLNRKKIYGMLLHNFELFKKDASIYQDILEAKYAGKIIKSGFSVYHPEEVEYLLERAVEFELLQVPYSVFDRRFESLLPILKKKGVEVHVRSVFLQGLFFKDTETLSEHFVSVKGKLRKLQSYAKETEVSLAALCINFALLNNYIDKIVVGVDSLENLKEDLESAKKITEVNRIYDKLQNLKVTNNNILLPFAWK